MSRYLVTVLRATVKVVRSTAEGKPIMEPFGDFDHDGKPVLRISTRPVNVRKDELLPDNVATGEIERLSGLGVIREVADDYGDESEIEDPAATLPAPAAAAKKPAARGRGRGKKPAAPVGAPENPSLDLEHLGDATDDHLAAGIKGVSVPDLVAAVGEDKELATRVLAAENVATGQDPREDLVEALQKLIDGGDA